jgi:hypothetical protein
MKIVGKPSFYNYPPRVAIVQIAIAYDAIFVEMMKRLRRDFNTRFIILCNGSVARACYSRFVDDRDKFFDVIDFNKRAEEAVSGSASSIYELARKFEEKYGVAYLRDVILQDRNYSTIVMGNAPFHPLSQSKHPPLACLAARTNAWFTQAEQWIDEEGVDLIFGRPDSVSGAPLVYVAEQRGIPVTVPVSARFKGRAAWTFGGYRLGDFVRQASMESDSQSDSHENNPEEVRYHSEILRNPENIARPSLLLRKLTKSALSRAIMRARDIKSFRRSKRTSFKTEVGRAINTYRVGKWLDKHATSVNLIKSSRYVLYLMNVEPEFGSHSLAREFWNSLAIVQQLALSLPAGYQLVIKEHAPAIGNRSIDYYSTLIRLPNVVFVDYRIKGTALAENAACVATISGTIGYEASLIGKSVVTFTSRTIYNHLPNIYLVENIKLLPSVMRSALKEKSREEILEIKKQAALLFEGIKITSFEASGSHIFKGGTRGITAPELDVAYELLLANALMQRKFFGWDSVLYEQQTNPAVVL